MARMQFTMITMIDLVPIGTHYHTEIDIYLNKESNIYHIASNNQEERPQVDPILQTLQTSLHNMFFRGQCHIIIKVDL